MDPGEARVEIDGDRLISGEQVEGVAVGVEGCLQQLLRLQVTAVQQGVQVRMHEPDLVGRQRVTLKQVRELGSHRVLVQAGETTDELRDQWAGGAQGEASPQQVSC